MNAVLAPSIFESNNAKALRPNQVAMTFVPPPQFNEIIRRRNTIVVGPRGSGKTTMLKMLQQPALEAWDHPDADAYRARIDYSTAFIATDISWGAQVEALGDGSLDPESHRRLSIAAFTTHVLRGVVRGMIDRVGGDSLSAHPFRRATLSVGAEADLVREAATAWHLSPAVPSLISLRRALSRRLLEIREFASREVSIGSEGREQRIADARALHLHFMQAASFGVELFNDAVGEPDGKWALLFDELEIAPDWIREELLRSLRGTDERFLLKLALSPYLQEAKQMDSAFAATPGNDFDQVSLWYAEKRDGYTFCSQLWSGILRERELPDIPAKDVLGRSYFETPLDEWRRKGNAYGPGSRLGKLFVEMETKDPSFREYLRRRHIDVQALHKLSGDDRAAEIRKIAPLLAVRRYYRSWPARGGDAASRARSRKQATLYAGAESLFAISEGNPRWFIGLVDKLVPNIVGSRRRVPPRVQADELVKTAQRFSALLRTIPLPQTVAADTRSRRLLTVINAIGDYFHRAVVSEEFSPEPPGTFVVDSHTPPSVLALLAQALNSGAIVYVPDQQAQLILSSLRGKRFRLSYLLAPLHRTPLRLGRPLSLSTILGDKQGDDQLDLVEDIDR